MRIGSNTPRIFCRMQLSLYPNWTGKNSSLETSASGGVGLRPFSPAPTSFSSNSSLLPSLEQGPKGTPVAAVSAFDEHDIVSLSVAAMQRHHAPTFRLKPGVSRCPTPSLTIGSGWKNKCFHQRGNIRPRISLNFPRTQGDRLPNPARHGNGHQTSPVCSQRQPLQLRRYRTRRPISDRGLGGRGDRSAVVPSRAH